MRVRQGRGKRGQFVTLGRSLIVTKRLQHLLLSLTIGLCLAINESTAQGPAAPVVVPANVVKQSRPYYVEGAVVVLLMAAAGYAVCRSSRRV